MRAHAHAHMMFPGAESRRKRLLPLLRLLVDEGVLGAVELNRMGDPDAGLNVRLKVQKYVYFARFFGYDAGYRFDMYLRGPYSAELADDLHELNLDPAGLGKVEPARVNARFIALVRGKDERWLEAAAIVMMLREDRPDLNERLLIGAVHELKSWASEGYIHDVMRELDAALGRRGS
ncbi:MAG: hypothetical protein ACP5QE_06950 [Conexivisphaera sp.]